MGGLYGDGIIGLKGAFDPALGGHALRGHDGAVRGGAAGAGWSAAARAPALVRRNAARADPRLRGIAPHPWFVAVCEAVLTKDYRIVEIGFDIPFPGAADQPWHRDFKAPDATIKDRRLNSLAFNLTAVDTRPEHGPFEIALGTQWDDIPDAKDDMFPDRSRWERYISRAVQKMPQRGDISARSALTIHRGTANRSNEARPVLVIGVDAPDAANAKHHDLQVTRAFLDSLPGQSAITLLPSDGELEPIIQQHVIEGLLEADYG